MLTDIRLVDLLDDFLQTLGTTEFASRFDHLNQSTYIQLPVNIAFSLSHAICKQPAVGDFRVQEEHGAQIHLIEAPSELRKVGATCLGAIPQTLLYSRIDLVRLATGELAVMEVELIEPSLYFDQDPDAAERFAQIFDEMMNENTD